jgi:hypothetical protein
MFKRLSKLTKGTRIKTDHRSNDSAIEPVNGRKRIATETKIFVFIILIFAGLAYVAFAIFLVLLKFNT